MCARFTLSKELSEFRRLIDFVCRVTLFTPRYNIAPRQQVPVIVRENYLTVVKLMRWGLIPSWATDESVGDSLINARAESLTEKSSFRRLIASQRCLIPADGYYEWQADGQSSATARRNARRTGRIPFRFTMKDGGLFCFAGLWDKWIRAPRTQELLLADDDGPQPGQIVETFTIITTAPNEMVAAVHDRMPVILHPEHYGWWLYEEGKDEALKSLLRPFPAEEMKCYRVSELVNNARNDSPACIKPA
jgi:putative SOS response-associated peptidase YedK